MKVKGWCHLKLIGKNWDRRGSQCTHSPMGLRNVSCFTAHGRARFCLRPMASRSAAPEEIASCVPPSLQKNVARTAQTCSLRAHVTLSHMTLGSVVKYPMPLSRVDSGNPLEMAPLLPGKGECRLEHTTEVQALHLPQHPSRLCINNGLHPSLMA